MTDLEAQETIEAMHDSALRDKQSLKERIAELKADYEKDPWEDTAAQIRRLEDRLVVRGLDAEALAIALSHFPAPAEERVIFRKFPHNGEVIALFPDQYNERNGNINSYMHNGQHAETAPDFGDTKPAEYADYHALYTELFGHGYRNLKVVKRFGKLGRK